LELFLYCQALFNLVTKIEPYFSTLSLNKTFVLKKQRLFACILKSFRIFVVEFFAKEKSLSLRE
jgi:hypothetical protein